MVVQELQALPKDVDKHFSELAKAHPICMKAGHNTMDGEKEKRKESMRKELKGLMDRERTRKFHQTRFQLVRFVKRKSRLVICGNFLNPYGETSTANLDVSVLRAVVTRADMCTFVLPRSAWTFNLIPANTLWKLKRALYGVRESPKLWEKKRGAGTPGPLCCAQSLLPFGRHQPHQAPRTGAKGSALGNGEEWSS
eukprot:2047810-Amphidinium_carterae.1